MPNTGDDLSLSLGFIVQNKLFTRVAKRLSSEAKKCNLLKY